MTELLWNIIWKFSPNDSHKWLNQENIFVIKKCGYINLFGGQSLTTVLSLEHLIPMTHTGLLQSIHSTPSFPPAALIPGGRGACILDLVRVGIWIGLSLLEQSRAVRSHPPPLSSFGYGSNIMTAGRTVGWMTGGVLLCDISPCDGDDQILSWPLLLSLSETERKSESPVLQRIQYLQ